MCRLPQQICGQNSLEQYDSVRRRSIFDRLYLLNGGFPMSKKRNRTAFFYVLPCLIVLGLFVYYPLVMNVTYSFQSFTLSAVTKEFVGLANFRKLLL